ncbi:MAG TPA: DUF6788 family protein [Halococcus sp.]|nr:DUF6788 family protein [Halococcus sp.]
MPAENPPTAPPSLPNYLADGLPKQDVGTLTDAHEYIEELIEWSQRPVEDDDLPEEAESVDDNEEGKGTVVKEKVKCGDETCKCMTEGELHGPYLYRYFREGGTLTSEYIGKP